MDGFEKFLVYITAESVTQKFNAIGIYQIYISLK